MVSELVPTEPIFGYPSPTPPVDMIPEPYSIASSVSVSSCFPHSAIYWFLPKLIVLSFSGPTSRAGKGGGRAK